MLPCKIKDVDLLNPVARTNITTVIIIICSAVWYFILLECLMPELNHIFSLSLAYKKPADVGIEFAIKIARF